MFEETLFQYGMAGIFVAYLIYDRQYIIKNFMREFREALNRNTSAINKLLEGGKYCGRRK
jgi:hypothetical protein